MLAQMEAGAWDKAQMEAGAWDKAWDKEHAPGLELPAQ